MLDLCCVDSDRVPRDVVDRLVALATRRRTVAGIDAAFLDAARSVLRHLVRREQLQAAMRSIDVPVLLLQGDRDRLVSVECRAHGCQRPTRTGSCAIAEGVGHVPQLEAPDWTAGSYREWIDSTGVASGGREPLR